MATSDLYELRFEWPQTWHNNVFVTGTFDSWTRSVKLTKTATGFVGTVKVPYSTKILYKFVVDGEWHCLPGKATERDPGGYVNNVLWTPHKSVVVAPPTPVAKKPVNEPEPSATPSEAAGSAEKTQEPAPESSTNGRKPIVILPLNSTEHNTVGSTTQPAVPDFVLPPPPRARSASPAPAPALKEQPKPEEVAPEAEQLNEVLVPAEQSVEEQKQAEVAKIPVDEKVEPTPEPVEVIKPIEEEKPKAEEKPVVVEEKKPEPVTTPAPVEVKENDNSKATTLPTPPATPRPTKEFETTSPSESPSSSRFNTPSKKKRRSLFGKLKTVFSDKDKEKVKNLLGIPSHWPYRSALGLAIPFFLPLSLLLFTRLLKRPRHMIHAS